MKVAVIAFVFGLLTACTDPITWSAECQSPDGIWTATARTVEHGGFGTGGVETIVDIKHLVDSTSPVRVLAFAEEGRAIGLTMRWDSPSHLLVTYDADPKLLYYQVVKASGVDISVENLSTK